MMKLSDVKVAMALIIQGYMEPIKSQKRINLLECLCAIREEIIDWSDKADEIEEDLSAVKPEAISIDLNVPRTPYNLRSAMKALADEAKDLDGRDTTLDYAPATE